MSEGPTQRMRHKLLSQRPDETSLPGEEATKRPPPAPVAALLPTISSFANILIPMAVFFVNFDTWPNLQSAEWYCLPKMALILVKIGGVAFQSRVHGLQPEKKDIDLDKGAYKFAIYVCRVAADALVAPLWYHFLGEKLFSLTATSIALGLVVGATAWVLWLTIPMFLADFRVKHPEPWNPFSFYGPGWKAPALIALRLAHTATLNVIVDELYFRGFIFRWLTRCLGGSQASTFVDVSLTELHLPAAMITAVLFSASHTRQLSEVPFWFTFWMVNHLLTATFGCLGTACMSTGAFSLCVGLWIVSQKEWHLW